MKNKIKIVISTEAGAGKSAIAFAIRSFLESKGFACYISGCEDEASGVLEKTWADRLNTVVKMGVEVEIKTQQLKRD